MSLVISAVTPRYLALKGFRLLVSIGLAANLCFALPALFAPRFLESIVDIGASNTPYWLQSAGVLLIIISMMCVPAIRDPFRYLFIACLLIAGRFAAGLLFLIGTLAMAYPDGFLLLAIGDLALSSTQALLLYGVLRDGDPYSMR